MKRSIHQNYLSIAAIDRPIERMAEPLCMCIEIGMREWERESEWDSNHSSHRNTYAYIEIDKIIHIHTYSSICESIKKTN